MSSLAASGAADTADLIPVITKAENDIVAELPAIERANYRDARDRVGSDEEGVAGTKWGLGGLDDVDLSAAAARCLTPTNSFGGATLVEMADGTMLPIADVVVGDQVLAYDFVTGETIARDVTATLPHTDWLLEAHLSDGSVMSVTEDHRFWSITDNGWVELQDLDPTDRLLTPDGATVTVDWLDWDAGVDAPAWDLTVSDEHNFFVAADATAEPVLVHNNTPGLFCGIPVSAGVVRDLRFVDALLQASDDVGRVNRMLLSLSRQQRVKMLDVITASGSDAELGATISRNASFGNTDGVFDRSVAATRVALQQSPEVAASALGNSRYLEFLQRSDTSDWLTTTLGYRSHLKPLENGDWVSDAGLRYRSFDPDPEQFDTRVDHILDHTRPRARTNEFGEAIDHGVFDTANPLLTVDEAWLRASSGDYLKREVVDGRVTYIVEVVEAPGSVGFVSQGASSGERSGLVSITVEQFDETLIVTAFPVRGA